MGALRRLRAHRAAVSVLGSGVLAGLALTLSVTGSAIGAASFPKHAPIMISSNSDFTSPNATTGCRCVNSGNGTTSSFVIGPWSINNANGAAVTINGGSVTASFDLHNLVIAGNNTPNSEGVLLNDVNLPAGRVASVSGSQTSIQTVGTGVFVDDSSNVTLDGGGANTSGPGIKSGAGVMNKNSLGAIYVKDSNRIMIRGWQLNANGADGSPDWIGFDPDPNNVRGVWNVGGVRFFDVTNSTVDHNQANNDTSISYSLFDSNNDTISNNTANYPFTTNVLITDGSWGNQVIDNAFATGDFTGILIADPLPQGPPYYGTGTLEQYGPTYDNSVIGNTDHSDGPTGTEKAAGQAPSFVGGIVVLNGAPFNTIENNTVWANAGGGLVWAQAIPASTPIGVATDPPIIHCNVTVSDGGSNLANQNGNVWTGNSVQAQDGCIPPQ